MQFEDGVSHGCQHPLPFQDVDIPQPQGQREWGLFQTHRQITKGMMQQRLLPSLHHFASNHTTGFARINLKHKNVFYHLWLCLKANELGWPGKYLKSIHECRKKKNFPHMLACGFPYPEERAIIFQPCEHKLLYPSRFPTRAIYGIGLKAQ